MNLDHPDLLPVQMPDLIQVAASMREGKGEKFEQVNTLSVKTLLFRDVNYDSH
jgi:hypothetical protein